MRTTGNKKKEELLRDHAVRARIAERAYFISESEGFPMGRETVHWLQAEIEIIDELNNPKRQGAASRGKGETGKGKATAPQSAAPTGKATNGKAAAPKTAKKPRTATASSAKAKNSASKKS